MDFSKCIEMKRVLAVDAFKPGTAHRILIHDPRLINNIVTVPRFDDNDMFAYDKDIELLTYLFDRFGFDAICIEITESEATFVSSYIGFQTKKTKKILQLKIKITADIIDDIISGESAGCTPNVEILKWKEKAEEIRNLFLDKHVPDSKHGDDSTTTGDNR